MRDSAGTTQFEVLPYIKRYVKKQLYKDKKIYSKKIEGGRFYTDHYIKKHNIKDFEDYDQRIIKPQVSFQIILGWNLGVAFFFDYIEYSKIDYYLELFKFKYLNKTKFNLKLPFYENWNEDNKKYDYLSLMNTNFYRESCKLSKNKIKGNLKQFKK